MRPSNTTPHPVFGAGLADAGTLDLGAAAAALWRRRAWIIGPTMVALILSAAAVQVIRPTYKGTAQVLLQSQESSFTRPTGEQPPQQGDTAIDDPAIGSQVQVILSRDLAKQAIDELELGDDPDFDPLAHDPGLMERLGRMLGLVKDPSGKAHDERVLDSYLEALSVYPLEKSRVIAIEFSARDPDLAARAANTVADLYIEAQQASKRTASQAASESLSPQLDPLRQKVARAEAAAEAYRARNGLFVGQNASTLSNQQLSDINTQLSAARSQQTDAQARAKMIRSLLASGRPVELSEVTNNELVRRLVEQRVALQAQLAQESRTLLPGHPRIKELRAQLDGLQEQIAGEALRTARSLENDAALAGSRVEALTADLDRQKTQTASSNEQSVQLRALELEAKSERDLLESYLTRYREATARASLADLPADGRVVSRATPPATPYFPRKGPLILIATLLAFVLSSALVAMLQLLSHPSGVEESVVHPQSDADGWREALMPVPGPVDLPATAIRLKPASIPVAIQAVADRLRASGEAGHRIVIDTLAGSGTASQAAGHLARALAARGMGVIVLDLDDAPPGKGLGDLLSGLASFTEVIQRPPGGVAHAIARGTEPELDEALMRERSVFVLDALGSSYDVAIVAGSPGVPPSFQTCLAAMTAESDECVLLAGGAIPWDMLSSRRTHLNGLGTPVVTVIDGTPVSKYREAA